ncbi:MAG: precorrin isomerase [Eubacterium sp.]|nr:precorrin isomerase [Eubacterium sp.]
MDIEAKSFEIISQELEGRIFDKQQEPVIKRVIHTTADFDYADNLFFSENVINAAIECLKTGASIVTDTQMAMSGINKAAAKRCGCEIRCFMSDEDVAEMAAKEGITRAAVAMRKAAEIEKPLIIVVGNAPTALIELDWLVRNKGFLPKLIIGVPVGFVNVVESKEMIMKLHIPHIVASGRKGGSNVAAAIINAILYMVSPRDNF